MEEKNTPEVLTEDQLKEKAKGEIATIQSMEMELSTLQELLANNPEFTKFLTVQKQLNEKTAEFWSNIKDKMLDSGVKSIKGDWGWITVRETKTVVVEDETKLPRKFFKRQIDTALLKSTVSLTGKLPAGTTEKVTHKLMKKINEPKKEEN